MRHSEKTGEHLATLDVLRVLAVAAVLAFHFLFRGQAADGYLTVSYPEVAGAALYGYLGVNLFFMVSGFVIAASTRGRSVEAFALARFVRLYPGFLICMTITAVVLAAAANPAFPISTAQYLANLTMVAPALGQPFMDGAYWSIVLELVFYGWMTLALLTGLYPRYALELVTGWLLLAAVNEFVVDSGAVRTLFVTEFAPYFAAGIALHTIRTQGYSREGALVVAGAFLLACSTTHTTRDWMLAHYGAGLTDLELVVANGALFGLFGAALACAPHLRPTAWLTAAGAATYPLYLLHQNIGYVGIEWLAPRFGRWESLVLVASALVVASMLVWRLGERPVQSALRRSVAPLVDAAGSRIRKEWTRARAALRKSSVGSGAATDA